MRVHHLFLAAALILSQMPIADIDARDGGGNRGGGGGGRLSGGGGHSIQRSPSMSRVGGVQAARPQMNRQYGSAPQRIQSRPQFNQSQAINRSTPQRIGGNADTRGQIQQFMREHPTKLPANRPINNQVQFPNRPAQNVVRNPGVGSATRANNQFNGVGNSLRMDVHNRYPNRGQWFNNNFWDNHRYRPPYYSQLNNWWGAATIGGIGSWLGWQGQPYYYGNYSGADYSADYWGPSDYDFNPAPETYAQQSDTIVATGAQSTNDEWMPLGVFAVSNTGQSAAYPNMFVQLALNKQGVISGAFYNSTTDLTYEIGGMVDPSTQRAVWKITDYPDVPVVETGIYNLAESEVPIRLYFSDGNIKDKLLVRIQDQ